MVDACPSTKVCSSCKSKRHNTLLHREQDDNNIQNTNPLSQPTTSSGSSSAFVGAACTNSTVVLGTVIVHVKGVWDQVQCVRVLLDSGSQISAMTSECAAWLGLSKRGYKSDIVGFAQSPISQVQGVTSCQFSSRFNSDYLFPSVELVILKQITSAMPSVRLPASVRSKYQHLRLADNNFDIPSRVDALFGADILPSLVRPHAGVEHHPGLPSALDTQLGWIVFESFATLKLPPGKYFIPHHAVLKADGDMAKIRVVFDASSTSSSGHSLNDVLCTGPKLQIDLRDILLRCRLHKYILTADIVKMYRQILIHPEDRVFQHVFWRDSPTDDLQEFQLCTVTYGLNCAPYLAIRCLHELDAQEGHRFPLAKGVLTQAAYVEDIVIGSDTEEQLLRRKCDIVGLLCEGACELSKWTSNSALVLESLHPDDRIDSVSFDPQDEQSVKVLDLHWITNSDNFAYHTRIQQISSTKRQVLSVIARLFDPIGALGPLLLWAKCFMQSLWCSQLGWDDVLSDELLRSWRQFCLELTDVFDLSIPRYIPVVRQRYIQLLGFADASIKGYAATIYLRNVDAARDISVKFITCKTKVAPLKSAVADDSLSIPRLELCGALLLAQTMHHVHHVLSSENSITSLRAWTNSSIVLS